MYYAEKIIDGVLCYKHSPRGNWIQMSQAQLTRKVERLQAEVQRLSEPVVISGEPLR